MGAYFHDAKFMYKVEFILFLTHSGQETYISVSKLGYHWFR